MKLGVKILVALIFVFSFLNPWHAGAQNQDADTLLLEGTYQGRNLYVQFGYNPDGVGFCLYMVKVNGEILSNCDPSSAIEIPLNMFADTIGMPIKVEIIHPSGCTPKVLNPHAGYYPPRFHINEIYIDSADTLRWVAEQEKAPTYWQIEQYRWNKWVKIGELKSLGEGGPNTYAFDVGPYIHSGENEFRVKKVGADLKPRYSKVVKTVSG